MGYTIQAMEQMIADKAANENSLKNELIQSAMSTQKGAMGPRAVGEWTDFMTNMNPEKKGTNLTKDFTTRQQDQTLKAQLANSVGDGSGLETMYKTRMASMAAMAKQQNGQDNVRDLYKDFRSDPFVKTQTESMAAAGKLKDLIDQNNPAAYQTFKTMLIRFGGDNRPSDYDIKAAGGSQALVDRWDQFVEKLSTGEWSETNVDLYKKMMNAMYNTTKRNLDQSVETYASNAPVVYKVDPITAKKVLSGIAQQGSSTFENANDVNMPSNTLNSGTVQTTAKKPKTVTQNGIKYTLNEATGQYE